MEAADILRPPYSITADSFVMNFKEETPGVIRSNVDPVTPVYSLVPIIKLEPGLENAFEEPVGLKFTNANLSVREGSSSAMNEIEDGKCFLETLVSSEPLSKASVSRKFAPPRVTYNLIPDFVDNVDEKFQIIPELLFTVNEYTDLKPATMKTHTPDSETCRENAVFKESEYPKTVNMSELNIRACGSVVNEQLNVAMGPSNVMKEPELINDVFNNSSGDVAPFGMIVRNPEAPPSALDASEMILGNCEVPLLPDVSVLNTSDLGELEALRKRIAKSGSLPSDTASPRFTDPIDKEHLVEKLRGKRKKQPVTKSKASFKKKEGTFNELKDSGNILDLFLANILEECVTRSSSQKKSFGQSFEASGKGSNILSLLDASPGQTAENSCTYNAKNSLNPAGAQRKIIRSKVRQAVKRNLRKPIDYTGLRDISVEDNLILDASVRIASRSKMPENIAADNNTPSSVSNEETSSASSNVPKPVFVTKKHLGKTNESVISTENIGSRNIPLEDNLITDASVRIASGSKMPKNVAADNNTPSNVSNKETSSASSNVSKPVLVTKNQSGETIKSVISMENIGSRNISVEDTLILDASDRIASGSKIPENVAADNNTPSSVSNEEISSASSNVPKSMFVTKKQLGETNESVKSMENIGSRNISVEDTLILDASDGIASGSKIPENVAADNNTPSSVSNEEISSASSNVPKSMFVTKKQLGETNESVKSMENIGSRNISVEDTLILDASDGIASGSKIPENGAADNNTLSGISNEETSSASNNIPKHVLVTKKQSKGSKGSTGTVGCDEAAKVMRVTKCSVLTARKGKISSSDFLKPVSVFKQEQKKVKSSKRAANCTASSRDNKEMALTPKGYPKPMLISIEQWKEAPNSFIHSVRICSSIQNRYTFYFNKKVSVKTTMISPSFQSGKSIPRKELLIFIEGEGWACDRCEQIFLKSHLLEEHKKGCRVGGIACTRCPRAFDSLMDFKAHFEYCQKSVYKCPECPKVFTLVPLYESHYSQNHESTYICIDCSPPRNFKSKDALQRHIIYHHLSPKVMCKTCGELKHPRHKCVKRHTRERKEGTCIKCGLLLQPKQMKTHMRAHNKVTCEACGKVLQRKTIKKHMRMHDRKKLVCMHCGSHFTAERSLQIHWKTHNDTGNPAALMCAYCGKFFELKTELVKHLKEHEGERNFICEHCGKGFFRFCHLDTHLLSHKEKQFICPKCNRGFVLRHQLAAHLQTIACGGNNVLPSAKDNRKLVKTANVKSRSLSKKQNRVTNAKKGFVSKRQLASHLNTVRSDGNALSKSKHVLRKKAKRKIEEKNAKPFLSSTNQFICANCNQKFTHKHQIVAHFGTVPCGSSAVSSTTKEDSKKSSPVPKKQFITAFENFVHERQLATSCDSVTCSGDVISYEEKPEAVIKRRKSKVEQMKPMHKSQGENSGHCFARKRRFASRSSTASCGDSVLPSLEMIETKKVAKSSRSKSGKQFSCANCNQDFVLKRQLAAHVRIAACNNDAVLLSKQTEKICKENEDKKKESTALVADKLLVCGSCNQGFTDKHCLNAHLCTAASCSHALSLPIEAKSVVERKEVKKRKLSSISEKQLACQRDFVPKQQSSRSGQSGTLTSSERTKKIIGMKEPKNKKLISFLDKKQFVCGKCDQSFMGERQLSTHSCTLSLRSLKKVEFWRKAKSGKTMNKVKRLKTRGTSKTAKN